MFIWWQEGYSDNKTPSWGSSAVFHRGSLSLRSNAEKQSLVWNLQIVCVYLPLCSNVARASFCSVLLVNRCGNDNKVVGISSIA